MGVPKKMGIKDALNKEWTLEDAGIILNALEDRNETDVSSERVFIDDAIAEVLKDIPQLKFPILTYFLNSLNTDVHYTPYSFVSKTA